MLHHNRISKTEKENLFKKTVFLFGIRSTGFACLLTFAGAAAHAATLIVGPSDCSAAAVNAAITSASNGDTVLLACAGTVTWSSTVNIPNTKGITLQVQGGTNTPKTSANFPLIIVGASNTTVIDAEIGLNHAVTRITGFKFQNSGTADPFIKIGGQGNGTNGLGDFRI